MEQLLTIHELAAALHKKAASIRRPDAGSAL
jgi:hypothetical protein